MSRKADLGIRRQFQGRIPFCSAGDQEQSWRLKQEKFFLLTKVSDSQWPVGLSSLSEAETLL